MRKTKWARALEVAAAAALLAGLLVHGEKPAEAQGTCLKRYSNWPCAHWYNYDGVNGADVVFVDHTSSAWPVNTQLFELFRWVELAGTLGLSAVGSHRGSRAIRAPTSASSV